MTLKEQYWRDGTIFRMSTNEYRMVWGNKLIGKHGYIPKICINDVLYNSNSLTGEHVIEVYAPNNNAKYFGELINPNGKPIWSRYYAVYTIDEIKSLIGLSEEKNIFILQKIK